MTDQASLRRFKPEKQRILHDPENGMFGDCYRTSVAMCLGLSPEEVPHFCDSLEHGAWRVKRDEWLAAKGYAAIEIPWDCDLDVVLKQSRLTFGDAVVSVSGYSPRGALHECVIYRGQLYDPHPDEGGLIAPHDDGFFWVHAFTHRAAADGEIGE